ncbi:MAG TPA: hypothetical protein VGD83_05825 [Streptosporangiaceae bacterium]
MISEPWSGDGFDLERARLELDRLVDAAWNGADRPASPDQHHLLRAVGRDLAAKIFISGQIAGRPSMEALEQVITAASERVRGFPDESRGIAEAVMALLEDPKQERRVLLPRGPREAEAFYQYQRRREQLDRSGS